jgi:hypothetical protein
MWSIARYDLHLTTAEFYRLTLRQFHLLWERHREALAHREMVAAFTTASVINHSMCPPKEGVPWTRFAPSLKNFKASGESSDSDLSDAQRQQIHDHNVRALEMTAKRNAEKQCKTNSPCSEPNSTPSSTMP